MGARKRIKAEKIKEEKKNKAFANPRIALLLLVKCAWLLIWFVVSKLIPPLIF
jgi:hypothetical protein